MFVSIVGLAVGAVGAWRSAEARRTEQFRRAFAPANRAALYRFASGRRWPR